MKVFTKYLLILCLVVTFPFTVNAGSSLKNVFGDLEFFRNISPQSSTIDAYQTDAGSRPELKTNQLGKLPGVEFDRSNSESLNFDGKDLANSDYTVFVVEKRSSADSNNFFIGTSNAGTTSNTDLILGYKSDTELVWRQGSDEIIIPIEAYSATQNPVAHTFIFSVGGGKQYYRNGALIYDDNTQTTPLVDFTNATIGNLNDTSYYNGIIGEVAIFKRALGYQEIDGIHGYITDKWVNVQKIKKGTTCTTGSPGYIGAGANISWNESVPVDNGGQLTFSACTGGTSQVGTVGALNCKNGVFTRTNSGTCENLGCSDPNISDPLPNGTWDSTSANDTQVVTGTCSGGYAGSPTITCTAGTYGGLTGSCVAPQDCPAHSVKYNSNSLVIAVSQTSPNTCATYLYNGYSSGSYNYCCPSGKWVNLYAILDPTFTDNSLFEGVGGPTPSINSPLCGNYFNSCQ